MVLIKVSDILSNDKNLETALLKSLKKLHEASISLNTVKDMEFSLIKKFTDFLVENLDKKLYDSQIKKLSAVCSDRKILDSVDIMQVKISALELKEIILLVLKDLKEEDLKKLEELSKDEKKPMFFEEIFYTARIYKEIDEHHLWFWDGSDET